MPLFHATHSNLSPGQEIVANSDCSYYPEVLSILEFNGPPQRLSRRRCVFAAESVVAATTFLNSQRGDSIIDSIRVYEVAMPIYHKAPFRLIHEMGKRIEAGQSVETLVTEYWTPEHGWLFWEYFGPAFQVIREVPAASVAEMAVFHLSYDSDVALSKLL